MPERGLPASAVILLGIVLVIGAYAGWYRLSGEGRLPPETVAAIPERLAPLAEQNLPSPRDLAVIRQSPPDATAENGGPRVVFADPSTLELPPTTTVLQISPISAAAAQLPSRNVNGFNVTGLQPLPAATAATSPADNPAVADAMDTSRVVPRVSANSWIMVKDRTSNILLNRVLKAGESWPVPARPDLLLTAGNAGGTDILVDGARMPSLGGVATVRRDLALHADQIIPLDADQIKHRKLSGGPALQLAPRRLRQ